jgi:hypothetical protein
MEFQSLSGQHFPRWKGLKKPGVGRFPNGKVEIAKVGVYRRKDLVARSEVVGRWGKKKIGGKVGERAQG